MMMIIHRVFQSISNSPFEASKTREGLHHRTVKKVYQQTSDSIYTPIAAESAIPIQHNSFMLDDVLKSEDGEAVEEIGNPVTTTSETLWLILLEQELTEVRSAIGAFLNQPTN